MITPEYLKSRFDLYRKWFNTLLVKEFLNLPYRDQSKLLAIIEKFLGDCKRVHKEAKEIEEKTVKFQVVRIEERTVIGLLGTQEISLKYPLDAPLPFVGDLISCIIFCKGDNEWFSSKEELIIGRVK